MNTLTVNPDKEKARQNYARTYKVQDHGSRGTDRDKDYDPRVAPLRVKRARFVTNDAFPDPKHLTTREYAPEDMNPHEGTYLEDLTIDEVHLILDRTKRYGNELNLTEDDIEYLKERVDNAANQETAAQTEWATRLGTDALRRKTDAERAYQGTTEDDLVDDFHDGFHFVDRP